MPKHSKVIAAQCLTCRHVEAPAQGDSLYVCRLCGGTDLHLFPAVNAEWADSDEMEVIVLTVAGLAALYTELESGEG